ncbi:helix-turn-helix transcriptional regulator [Amycolatopsis rhabdoformis]|uniref:Helix-turn-helix transcriptional regulator n=1 Tax=Amycolatopsis rhabdoformis TaxID=1448059 RepID=A0ABZ1IGH1_9PSEU|nr:helix-turn-helix transcriptional regulator [Amycolatopsis rhabdoformis]WSE32876.1 helix-turn-helix transcriptional regulator [Amycolatopsis rhabdoformis]
MAGNVVGEYLRARREQVRPEDVGITVNSHRRVAGLRRDELAMLAGISTEYYTRLEQGRDRNPSAQVLDAVARVLGLDREATAYLHGLAAHRSRRGTPSDDPVRPSITRLIGTWDLTPAYVQGRYLDVLAANPIAAALSPVYTPGTNLLRAVLLEPAAQRFFTGWEARVSGLVASLRAGSTPDDPHLAELVEELSAESELFRDLWPRHDVRPQPGGGTHHLCHPDVGELELKYDKFAVSGADDQLLVVYQAEPGTPSEKALRTLLSGPGGTPAPPGRT